MAVFTDTVTIYNHCSVAGADTWHKTVLKNVQWRQKSVKAVTSDGKIVITRIASITIPKRDGYLPPKEWAASKHSRADCWTLNAENNLDVVVYGNCPAVINSDYGLKQLKRDYDVVTIAAAADNTIRDNLKHWKVEAK